MSQNFNMSDDEREMQLQRSIIARQNRELSDLKKRLAQYESQCIPRTADMPDDAVAWVKYDNGTCAWLRFTRTGYERQPGASGLDSVCTPDLLPDEPGPVYRHIVDVE